jgi:hypothetical protein
MLGGDYLRFIPGPKYQQARLAILGAGIKLMDELREELKRKAPVLPELTADPDKLEGEDRAKAIKELHEQQRFRLATSSAIIAYKELPERLREMEAKFIAFAEQEYRLVSPEKGEIENIIAHAGLPKEASERLRLLIPR